MKKCNGKSSKSIEFNSSSSNEMEALRAKYNLTREVSLLLSVMFYYDLCVCLDFVEMHLQLIFRYGALVAKWLAHLPFTSKVAGPNSSENFLNAT